MNFERRGPSGDSGKLYEARFLGQAEVDSEFVEAMRALPTDPRGRIPREAAFRTLKEHYAGDPTNPKGVHAKELRGAMLDALGLDEGDFDKLKLYSAVGTPIDVLFGVDAFLELEDPKTRQTVRATSDDRRDSSQRQREGGRESEFYHRGTP